MSHLPASSNILQRRWDQKAYQMHLKKNEEETQASIDYENRILLAKLTNILRSNGQLDNWNYDSELHSKSLNQRNVTKEQDKIRHENRRLLAKVINSRSTYDADRWEDDFLMHNYYLDLKNSSTKHQERGVGEVPGTKQPFIFYSADKPKEKQGETQEDNDKTRVPTSPSSGLKKYVNSDDIPDVNNLKISSTPEKKKKRRLPRLPVLGAERKKQNEKKKKDAAVRVLHYDVKDEAVKLFKATKGMGKPESVVINTLCKRTQTQRQLTKAKFGDQFGLELEEELSAQLDDDYCLLVGALLATTPDFDAVSIHRALKGDGPFAETLMEILCTRSNDALCAMNKAYSSKFQTSLEADIKAEVKGQLRHLLYSLVKGGRPESIDADTEATKKDAAKLKAARDGERWNADTGSMSELIKTASWNRINSVLHEYETMTGKTVFEEFEKCLFADYKDAMVSLVKCLRDCPKFLAEQLHENLQLDGDEMTVMRIIVMRSEVDMALIRKAYKKMYRETPMDSIRSLPMTCKRALAQMVILHGMPKKKMDAMHEQHSIIRRKAKKEASKRSTSGRNNKQP